MKKVLALLLVLCTLLGLVACGKKEPASTNSSTPTTGNNTTSDPTGTTEDPHLTVTPETSPYKGKTLQMYGLGTAVSYTNYDAFGKGNYLWMIKAAMEEWAAINGVTIEYKGAYNQNGMLAAIQSGEHPDLVWQSNRFPAMSNVGLTAAFTEAEYAKLTEVCNPGFLDLMKYKGASHGFIVPWVGNGMCYYNKTMFENYGVKTPKEYFMEGNWTWTTFTKCMEEMTRDIDNDGTIDTYGLPKDSMLYTRFFVEDENGRVSSVMDTQYFFDITEWQYTVQTVKKLVLVPGTNQIQKNVTYPMYAMQLSDCEPYNFEHLYQSIPNGDELEVVPVPRYDGKDPNGVTQLSYTQSGFSMLASCDEREATIDLLLYILKCGLKYMSDFSLGAVKCDYVGMQGKCDLSRTWMEAFKKVCEDRAVKIKEVENYDEELIAKIYEEFDKLSWRMYKPYAGISESFKELVTLPPASSIPAVKEKLQAQLDKYNELYIDKK